MNRVFVDTGGFYASLNRRDASHRDAARLFRRAQREHWFLFTTNFVLAESHALILARMGRNRAWNFLQAILILQRTFRARSRLQDVPPGEGIGVIWASPNSVRLKGSL
jgi:predicted nucleic acid-binding protein